MLVVEYLINQDEKSKKKKDRTGAQKGWATKRANRAHSSSVELTVKVMNGFPLKQVFVALVRQSIY